MYRQTAVAGAFYPSEKSSIEKFIKRYEVKGSKSYAVCAVVPHAGYVYSGATAVRVLSSVVIPSKVILLGPNHTGKGPKISLFPTGRWASPFGDVEQESGIISKLSENPLFVKDAAAHSDEHSLEVMLPLLKYFNPDVKTVSITMKYTDMEDIRNAAAALADAADADTMLLVSTDLNHFEDEETTEIKDKAVIDMMMDMNENGLYETVLKNKISMCGFIPACAGIVYSRIKGAVNPVFVEHTHSGKVNGDNSRVVGYTGLYYR